MRKVERLVAAGTIAVVSALVVVVVLVIFIVNDLSGRTGPPYFEPGPSDQSTVRPIPPSLIPPSLLPS